MNDTEIMAESQSTSTVDVTEIEQIPGTFYLVDAGHHVKGKHEKGHEDIVLVPQPSSDPNDPLNWAQWRKAGFMAIAIWYTIFICSVTGVIGLCTPGFEAQGLSPTDVSSGSGYCFLCLGWINLFILPLSRSYGRRPVILISLLACGVGCSMWLAYANTAGSYFGSRVVQGVFGAPVETLIEVLVVDIFFVHERAFWMSWYGFGLQMGSNLGPVASGFVIKHMGFRWVFYFHAIFMGGLAVLVYFFMEESSYHRVIDHGKTSSVDGTSMDDTSITGVSLPIQGSDDDITKDKLKEKVPSSTIEYTEGSIEVVKHGYWKRIRPFSRTHPFPDMIHFVRPIMVLYKFPQILWSGAMLAACISCFQVLTATIAEVLQAPPYNFSISSVGLAYLGPAISTLPACLYSGPLCDWFCLWMARRRGGIHEAEDRIYLGLICIILTPLGCFLYGIGAAHQVPWIVVVIGLSFMSAVITLSSNFPYSYALDCCQDLGSDCIVAIVLMRNTVSFGFAYAINPWIKNQGLQNTFIALGFILGFAFWGTAIPMIIYGKRVRKLTKETYYKWSQDH